MVNQTGKVGEDGRDAVEPGRMRWLLICPPLFFFWAVANVDKIGISIIAADPTFLASMGLVGKATEIGWLMTAFTLVYGVSSVFWGYSVDRIGARKSALIGIVLWVISLLVGAAANSYGEVLLSRLMLGLGEGMIFPVTNKYISAWFHPRELGKAQASWVYGQYIGPALGLPLLVWIIASFHWEAGFYTLAAVAVVINLPMIFLMTRDTPEEHPSVSPRERAYIERGRAEQIRQVSNPKFYRDPRYWSVCVAFVVVAALFYGVTFWMPTYLLQTLHMSPREIKASLSLSWLFAVLCVFVIGVLADRTKRPVLLGMLVYLVCGVSLALVPFQSGMVLVSSLLALALGCIASQLLLTQLILVKLAVPKNTGKAAGVIGLLNITGGFVTALMGYVVDATGGSYHAAFLLLAFFPFIGAIAYATVLRGEHVGLKYLTPATSVSHP